VSALVQVEAQEVECWTQTYGSNFSQCPKW